MIANLRQRAEIFEKAAARAAADPNTLHNVEPLLQLARRRRDAIAVLEQPASEEKSA